MEGEYLSLDTAKKIEAVKKVKAILPEGVEAVVISKDDYDRLSGELTKENIELKLEIERLNNIINELEKWLEEQHQFIIEIPVYTKEISIEHKTMEITYENVLDKIKELKREDKE